MANLQNTEQPAQQDPVAHEQGLYGWKVYGVNTLFTGEYAEHDAKAEAKRIGGTCIAFPLYTRPQAREPLTDDRVWLEYMQLWPFRPNDEPTLAKDILKFARAIEAAHGIKGDA